MWGVIGGIRTRSSLGWVQGLVKVRKSKERVEVKIKLKLRERCKLRESKEN